jgi:hypothetical protein
VLLPPWLERLSFVTSSTDTTSVRGSWEGLGGRGAVEHFEDGDVSGRYPVDCWWWGEVGAFVPFTSRLGLGRDCPPAVYIITPIYLQMQAWHAPPCVLSHTHVAPRRWHCVTPWYVHAGARPGLIFFFSAARGVRRLTPRRCDAASGTRRTCAGAVEKQSRSANVCHVGYPARNDGDTLLRTCSCSKNPPVPALSCNHRRRASGIWAMP